jgi:N-carbamoyl-L-amino-acid hydrolase
MNRRHFTASILGTTAAIAANPGALAALLRPRAPLRVNGARLNRHLSELAEFGKNPQGGVSRVAYSEADRQGREYVMGLMRGARLDVSVDAAGNIVGRRAGGDSGRRPGRDSGLPPLLFGSHIDSVPEGGNYDGDVGSLGAIEVAQTLAENDVVTRHPLEVIVFQNEEGGLIGSRALSGELTTRELDLVSRSGKTIREGTRFIGGDPDRIANVRRARGSIAAYLELHIEQGANLDAERIDIGVVEGIVGINWWDVTIEGFANHAGTTPMDRRRDALLAAARFIEAVNRVVTSAPGRHVGTVGRIQAFPGAPNVIPGKVVLSLELRDLDAAKIAQLYDRIRTEARQIAVSSQTTFDFKSINENTPAPTDPRVRELIVASARELGLTTKLMPSGAGHDAQDIARLGPVGMIFVPSVGGISHSPRELSRPGDITNGANVLLGTVMRVDEVFDRS